MDDSSLKVAIFVAKKVVVGLGYLSDSWILSVRRGYSPFEVRSQKHYLHLECYISSI